MTSPLTGSPEVLTTHGDLEQPQRDHVSGLNDHTDRCALAAADEALA